MFPLIPLFPPFPAATGLLKFARYAAPLWASGILLLWMTRYTHQLGRRWGGMYYALSAVIRPAGVVFLSAGWWLVLSTCQWWSSRGGFRHDPSLDLLCVAGALVSFGFFVWSVLALGLRRSFLFRHADDGLVTHGPYAIVRHPQFLGSIALTLFGVLRYIEYTPAVMHWVLFSLSLWLLSILEEKELEAHFGEAYIEYSRRVPRLFPN